MQTINIIQFKGPHAHSISYKHYYICVEVTEETFRDKITNSIIFHEDSK